MIFCSCAPAPEETETAEPQNEIRGVWIFYRELSMEDQGGGDAKSFENKISAIYDNCINSGINTVFVHVRAFADSFYPSKISIDNYSKSCLKNNWLNNGIHSWTMTAHEVEKTIPSTSEENTNETIKITNEVFSVSDIIEPLKVNTVLSIRPVVYLNSRILITSGTGTIEDPYIIK